MLCVESILVLPLAFDRAFDMLDTLEHEPGKSKTGLDESLDGWRIKGLVDFGGEDWYVIKDSHKQRLHIT